MTARRPAELILKELTQQESSHDSSTASTKTFSLYLRAIASKRMMNSQGDGPPADTQRREITSLARVGLLVVCEGTGSRYFHATFSSQIGAESSQSCYYTVNLSFNLAFSISYRELTSPTSVTKLKVSVETEAKPNIRFSLLVPATKKV